MRIPLILFYMAFYGLSFSQEVRPDMSFTEKEKISPDNFYLIRNKSFDKKVLLRFDDYSVIKGKDIPESIDSVFSISNEWKLSKGTSINNHSRQHLFYLKLYEPQKGLTKTIKDVEISEKRDDILIIKAKSKKSLEALLSDSNVIFIQQSNRKPKEETLIRQHDLGTNGIALSHHLYPELDGSQSAISIKENSFDSSDFDIAKRAIRDGFSSSTVELHATEIATLIGGNGSSYLSSRGVVKNTTMYSTNFSSLLPEPSSYYSSRNVSVQNHSYGVQIENFYGIESEAYDDLANSNSELLHVFSAGNSGQLSGTDKYEGIESYGTITGSFKQAKNVILVSSTDSLGAVSNFNSRGPAYDGRLKPDLVAFGGEGTSEAAALVSGAASLIQQKHFQTEGASASSSLVRALLIGGSTDINNPGPDFVSGFGQLNLYQSLQLLDSGWFQSGMIMNNLPQSFEVNIPANVKNAKFILTWNDTAANPGESIALVNDLDFTIEKDGEKWLPWVLDSTADQAALESDAVRGIDHLNNSEMITIANPEAGSYSLTISPFSEITQQSFSIAYSYEKKNSFQWMYPTGSHPLEGGTQKRVHWLASNENTGSLEINYLDNNWYPILSSVELNARQAFIGIPDTTALCKLRMLSEGEIYESDTFLISKEILLEVDLNCVQDLILKWQDIDVDNYSVRRFTNGKVEEIELTSDTFFIIDKAIHSSQYFSVLPIIGSKNGAPSLLLNVDQQGVGCFNSNFLVTLNREGFIDIKIELSGISQIQEASILKSTKGQVFQNLQSWSPESESISFQDTDLENGILEYQLKIRTLDGQDFYSPIEEISFTDAYLVFPNLVSDNYFNLLSPETGGILQICDNNGRIVAEHDIVSEIEEINVSELSQGQYHYRIVKDELYLSKGKLIIF